MKKVFFFLVFSSFVFAGDYQEIRSLYDGGSAFDPKDLPAVGVLDVYMAYPRYPEGFSERFAFWKTEIAGKTTEVRFQLIANKKLSNEEAAGHVSACNRFLPAASSTSAGNALFQWRHYEKYRWYHRGTPWAQGSYSFRSAENKPGKQVIVGRTDSRDGWGRSSSGRYVYIGEQITLGTAYWEVTKISAVEPAEVSRAHCGKLIEPFFFIDFP